jgi:hypothetical protein
LWLLLFTFFSVLGVITVLCENINCCRKGPLIIIRFPSLLLVRSRGPVSPGLPGPVSHGTVMPDGPVTVRRQVTVTRSLEWTSDVAGLGVVARAAGPGTVSRRGRTPIQVGLVGPGPGTWSAGAGIRQAQSPGGLTAYGRSDSLLEAAWSRHVYVYSFMRIRHLGFFVIDLLSDYKTDRHHFSLGSRCYGFVAIISGIFYFFYVWSHLLM